MAEICVLCGGSGDNYAMFDVSDWSTPTGLPTVDGDTYACHANNDGTLLAFATNGAANGKVQVYNTADWSRVTLTNNVTYLCRDVRFSHDGDYLAVLSQHSTDNTMIFRVYDTSDWSWHKSNYAFPSNNAKRVRWSDDDLYISIMYDTSPYIRIIKFSDWSTETLDSGLSIAGTPQWHEWSNDGAYIAVGHIGSPYLTVIDTSDWSDSGTDISSDLPATVYYVRSLSWSSDDAYLACSHDDGDYLTVFDTSDWSKETGLDSLNGISSIQNCFTTDDAYLLTVSTSVNYRLEVYDTSDWTLETTGVGDDYSGTNMCYVFNTPVYNQFFQSAAFTPTTDWGFSPSAFYGIAVIESGAWSTISGPNSGTNLVAYRDIGGAFYWWQEWEPINDEWETCAFAPGNKELWAGGQTPIEVGDVTRNANTRWETSFGSGYGWGFVTGSKVTSLCWSKDGKYRIHTFHDIYQHDPFFWYWDGDSWETYSYTILEDPGWTALGYYHRVSISPDGRYITQTAKSGGVYDPSPYLFILENDGTKFFTSMTINFDGNSFTSSEGMHVDWSHDSQYFHCHQKVFEYNDTSEEWEIIGSTNFDWIRKATWSLDGAYLVGCASTSVQIYTVSSGVPTYDSTIAFSPSTPTVVHFSADGKYLWVGTNATSGCLKQYDIDGGNFTAVTTNDFSDLTGTIVDIVSCDYPYESDAGKFQLSAEIGDSNTDFHDGLLFDAGSPLQMTYAITGQSSLYTTAPYPLVAKFTDDVSILIGIDGGKFSLSNAIFGDEVPATTAGAFIHTYSITGALPFAYDLLDLINAERALNSLDPYVINTKLTAASQEGLDEMVAGELSTYVSSLNTLLDNAGYIEIEASAIPAKIDESFSAQDLFDAWMDSPATEAIILDETMEDIGITSENYNGNNYVSPIFALWHPQWTVVDVPTITMIYSLPTVSFFTFLSAPKYATFLENSESVHLPRYAAKLGTYEIPDLVSFTYRLELDKPSYLSVRALFNAEVMDQIEALEDEGLSVESIVNYEGTEVRNEVVNVDFTEFSAIGGEGSKMSVGGYATLTYYESTVALRNVMTRTVDEQGKTRFRCSQPDFYIRPGCTVTYSTYSIVAKKVVIFVSNGINQYMEITGE